MAVCETAKEYGYSVPQDFCVTGFDNFDKASYHVPSITTVGHIREEVGYLCADILIRLWKGEAVPQYNYTATTPVYQESCGCNSGTERDVREYLKGQIMYGIESEEFAAAILSLESEMMQCNTVEEMMYCIPARLRQRWKVFYLVVRPLLFLKLIEDGLIWTGQEWWQNPLLKVEIHQ